MKRICLLCLLAVVVVLCGCSSVKHEVYKVDGEFKYNMANNWGEDKTRQGVFFALPRTVIRVDVPIEKKVIGPGAFYKDLRGVFQRAIKERFSELTKNQTIVIAQTMFEQVFINNNDHPWGSDGVKLRSEFRDLIGKLKKYGIEVAFESSSSFEMGKISLTSSGEPDPEQVFFANAKGHPLLGGSVRNFV